MTPGNRILNASGLTLLDDTGARKIGSAEDCCCSSGCAACEYEESDDFYSPTTGTRGILAFTGSPTTGDHNCYLNTLTNLLSERPLGWDPDSSRFRMSQDDLDYGACEGTFGRVQAAVICNADGTWTFEGAIYRVAGSPSSDWPLTFIVRITGIESTNCCEIEYTGNITITSSPPFTTTEVFSGSASFTITAGPC